MHALQKINELNNVMRKDATILLQAVGYLE